MNLAMLRVEGAENSLESLKSAISFNIDAEWKKGDKRRNGTSHELSGLSMTVANAKNPVELMQMVRAFLAQWAFFKRSKDHGCLLAVDSCTRYCGGKTNSNDNGQCIGR